MKKTTNDNKIGVLITTDNTKRGVFFAYINPEDADKETIPAEQIQMCIRWSSDRHGVLGLAAMGPSAKCRVSPPTPSGFIHGVTFVAICTPGAIKAWKSEPWGV